MTKVLVVSTLGYQKLEELLDYLIEKNPEKQYEFYIVNEMYMSVPPTVTKYSNYISTRDSTDENEINRIVEQMKDWPEFDVSIQTDEYAITILAIINSRLNLKGLTVEQEKRFRDKVRMKQLLSDEVSKPQLYNLTDIENDLVQYPVVVKPRTFAASRGVCIIKEKEELLKYISDKEFDYSRASIDTIDDIEVEEYIDANTCHIDGLIFNGKIIFCIASMYLGSCFEYAKGKTLGSITMPELQQKEALCFVEKVHKDLKMPDGAFHLETFWDKNNFVFLEVGIRPGGSEIVPTIEAATGINLFYEHLNCQLGIEPIFLDKQYKYFGWLNFPYIFDYESPKVVKSVTIPKNKPSSLYYSKFPQVGDKATADFVNYSNSLGNFIFISEQYEQLEKDMEFYAKEYEVEVE